MRQQKLCFVNKSGYYVCFVTMMTYRGGANPVWFQFARYLCVYFTTMMNYRNLKWSIVSDK
uniref:Uncharacterized protein n=1 Tax=Solanum tuberosum TaxID=4113 RepID=M1BSW0_SOLTU